RSLNGAVRRCATDGSVFIGERRRKDEENGGSLKKTKRGRWRCLAAVAAVRGERRGTTAGGGLLMLISQWLVVTGYKEESGEGRMAKRRREVLYSLVSIVEDHRSKGRERVAVAAVSKSENESFLMVWVFGIGKK
ncbi:hypothetical protein HAX54_033158, partial [Datura stramonium]|nr:hypothetical protein [Datura stramonium]